MGVSTAGRFRDICRTACSLIIRRFSSKKGRVLVFPFFLLLTIAAIAPVGIILSLIILIVNLILILLIIYLYSYSSCHGS